MADTGMTRSIEGDSVGEIGGRDPELYCQAEELAPLW